MEAPPVSVPLRTGKKMKKRKELDALVSDVKVRKKSISSQDLLHDSESTDMEDYTVVPAKRGMVRSLTGRACALCLPLCSLCLLMASVVTVGTVLWLHIQIRQEVDGFRAKLDRVEAGSQDIPEAMHEYHTQLQELQKNQSLLWGKINTFTQQISDLNKEVREMREAVKVMKKNLEAASELVQVPKDVENIKKSVASFGSKITDLEITVHDLKDEGDNTKLSYQKIETELSTVKHQLDTLKGNTPSQQPSQQYDHEIAAVRGNMTELSRTLNAVNITLSGKLQFATEDIHEHNGKITNLQDTAQNLKARVQTLENTGKTLQNHYAELENLTSLSTELTTQEGRITELDSKVDHLGSRYDELVNSQVSANSSIHHLFRLVSEMEQHETPTPKPVSLSVRSSKRGHSYKEELKPDGKLSSQRKAESKGKTVSMEEMTKKGGTQSVVGTTVSSKTDMNSKSAIKENDISASTKQLLKELDEAERTVKKKNDLHLKKT